MNLTAKTRETRVGGGSTYILLTFSNTTKIQTKITSDFKRNI
jgi:hypothetical protein